MKILAAEFVLPIVGDFIRDGAVAIDGEFIVAVAGKQDLLTKFPDADIEDFGSAAILPGFVNCHSHLEISSMRGFLDDVEHDFRSWLLKLTTRRGEMHESDLVAAAKMGVQEAIAGGVTCFGDIGRFGQAGLTAINAAGVRGVLFQETEFSPDNRTADDDFQKLIDKFSTLKKSSNCLVEIGLSPHSPYTVSPELFKKITQYAVNENVKLAIHVAESLDEQQLMLNGVGFFTEIYKKFGVEWNSPRSTSIEYLDSLGVLAAKPILAHCVHTDENDIAKIAESGSGIAHCPKSNAKFGHGYAPLESFMTAGIAVGLGSDSVASNNICDLLQEARFATLTARNHPKSKRFMSAAEALRCATLGGAEALGLDAKIGTLEQGKCADIAVISVARPAQTPIYDINTALVFSSNATDVVVTMVAGQEVYRASLPS